MNKKLGVGYLRVSDNKQEANHSENIQKKMILEKAEQEGITISHWRYDKAVSAYRKNAAQREKLNLLLEDAKEVDAIIFYDESRLTRKIFDFYKEIYQPLRKQNPNVQLFSTQSPGEWDPNDPLNQAKLVFAAEESKVKSMRIVDAQSSLLANKIRPGARSPLGYDLVDGVLTPNTEAEIVSNIFDLASWGHSNKKIADTLNAINVKTKYISQWNSSTIDYILKNSTYAGHLSWNVKQLSTSIQSDKARNNDLFNVHEAIISPVMFAVVTQVKSYKKKYGKLDTSFHLRNLIVCNDCSSLLRSKDNTPKGVSKNYRVYRCPNCKVNYPAETVHDEVKADLTQKWTSNLHQMIKESKFVLSDWLQSLQEWKRSLEQTEERILFNERFLDQQDQSSLVEIFEDSKQLINEKKYKINQAIEKIRLLEDENALYEVYSHFKKDDVTSLLNEELRTLYLTFIDEIKLENKEKRNFSLSINYRLNPFVELDDSNGQIIEDLANLLPEKPNHDVPN